MDVLERSIGAVTILQPQGRLVLSETQADNALRDRIGALLHEGRSLFIFDLTHVTHVDTSGLTTLVGAYIAVHKRGGRIVLLKPAQRVRDLLTVTRLNSFMEVFDSEGAALVALGATPLTPPSPP